VRSGYCNFEDRHIKDTLVQIATLFYKVGELLFDAIVNVTLKSRLTDAFFPKL